MPVDPVFCLAIQQQKRDTVIKLDAQRPTCDQLCIIFNANFRSRRVPWLLLVARRYSPSPYTHTVDLLPPLSDVPRQSSYTHTYLYYV